MAVRCDRVAQRGSRWCRVHAMGEVGMEERRAVRSLLADLAAVGTGEAAGSGEVRRREADLWRRAARGDYGELLDERLAEIMAAGEQGRIKGLLGQLVGAVAIALDGVMTEEAGDPTVRTLAVSRLAQATTRIVGARERLATGEAERAKGGAAAALAALLTELDAEDDARRAREREEREQGAGAVDGAEGWAEWTGGEVTGVAAGTEGEQWS